MLTAAALWATLGLFGKRLYDAGISPLEVASVRAAVGCMGLAAWLALQPTRMAIRPRDLPFFAVFGIVGVALFYYLYMASLERTTLSVASALLYTAPGFVLIAAWLTGSESVERSRLLPLGFVLAGVFLVTGAARALLTGSVPVTAAAVGLGLGAGLTYGLYTVFGKHALRRYPPATTVFWAFAFGALALAAVSPPWQPVLRRPDAIPLLLGIGLGPTLLAYLLYLAALRRMRATSASMLASVEPVIATGFGMALLGEVVLADQAVGVALVVLAAVLLVRPMPVARTPADV